MNNIDRFLLSFKNEIDDMVIKQGPSSEDIYQLLCNYESNNEDLSNSVAKVVSYIDKRVQDMIKHSLVMGNSVDLIYVNKNQGLYNKSIEINFNKHLPGVMEAIQLYLSIDITKYDYVVMKIVDFLINKHISFKLRLSKVNRNDNLIVALYSKNDVTDTMTFIRNNFASCLKNLNPFIYQIDNIGIVRDIKGISYNKYVSSIVHDYIEECILNQQIKPYTAIDLQRFIAYKCQDHNNYQDKVMAYNVSCSIYSILCKEHILKKINDKYNVDLNLQLINKFDIKIIDNEYHYYLDNKEIDYKTQVYLNALECLIHLYMCRYGDKKVKDYRLSSSIVNIILKDIEDMLVNKKYNIMINYTSKTLHKLMPYLYGYIASKYKGLNDEECLYLINNIKNRMLVLNKYEDDKYYYSINNQLVISSIPIISNEQGFVTIEYIDIDDNLVNITTIKNGVINSYLNVYIDIDKVIIRNNHNYYGKLYRNSIGSALMDNKRNDQALNLRQTDFKSVFISDKCREVNKYVKVDMIKKIFNKKAKGVLTNS